MLNDTNGERRYLYMILLFFCVRIRFGLVSTRYFSNTRTLDNVYIETRLNQTLLLSDSSLYLLK